MIKVEAVERENFRFDRRYFFFCMHSAVQQLLQFYRVPHAEWMIDAGWSCWLHSEGILRLDLEPLIKSRRSWYRIEFCQSPEDYPRLWQSNIDALNEGRPVVLGADYFFLPFHPRYQKQHGAHAVLLYGADEAKRTAWVADYNSPFVAFRGEISADDLRRARLSSNAWNGGINSGGSLQAACLDLIIDPQHPLQGGPEDVDETLLSVQRDYFMPDRNEIRGIHAVERRLRNWDRSEAREMPSRSLQLHGELLPLCEKKRLFACYLQDAHPMLAKAPSYREAYGLLEKINETWSTFLKVLLKIGYTPHEIRPLLRDARQLYESLMDLECLFSQSAERLYEELRS